MKKRCSWAGEDPVYIKYHDKEWGVPLKNNLKLFEFLLLEGQQAGLSWITVLKKREHYRRVFDGFNPEKIARYNSRKVAALLKDAGIIRNRLKVESMIRNSKAYLRLKEKRRSFKDYIWQFTGGETVHNRWKSLSQIPAKTETSDEMSKVLKRDGFNFVGSTICYAFMQATGMVNDHLTSCPRYRELS